MAFDIIQFCQDNNILYRTEGKNVSEGWVGLQDIYALNDTGYHLGFNTHGDYLYSWKGGRGYSLNQYLQDLLDINYFEASKIIREYDTYQVTDIFKRKKKFDIVETPTTPAIRNFLRHRRYNAEKLIDKYDLRGDGYKLVIPIYYNGSIVSYQTRDVREKFYIGCANDKSIINYKDILYPLDYCTKDYVVVVEGIFDAYRLGDNAVCTFGTSHTKAQATLLSNRFKKVVIMFDNEREAQKKAKKLGIELDMMGVSVEIESDYLRICDVNDPDELSNKQAKVFMKMVDAEYDM